jgi:hypothetical protein
VPLFVASFIAKSNMIEQVAWNKSSLILNIILQNTQKLQVFTKKIKAQSYYKLKHVAVNKSSLLLNITLRNTQKLQIFTKTIKAESYYKSKQVA